MKQVLLKNGCRFAIIQEYKSIFLGVFQMAATSKILIGALLISVVVACSPKKRSKIEEPTAPPPLQTAVPSYTPVAMPSVMPLPSGIPKNNSTSTPFKSGAPKSHGTFDVEEDEKKPLKNYNPGNNSSLDQNNGLVKRYTGFKDSSDNFYTDASHDFLITFLREELQKETEAAKRLENSRFAESIREVKFKGLDSGKIEIKILSAQADTTKAKKGYRHTKKNAEYSLSGYLQFGVAKLRANKNAGVGEAIAVAELQCLDIDDGSCETSLLKLRTHSGAEAFVILRKTLGTAAINMNEKQDYLSNSFKTFLKLRNRSLFVTDNRERDPFIEKVVVSSFAVVNGRSEVTVRLILAYAKSLLFKAPLYAPPTSSNSVNVTAKRTVNSSDISFEELPNVDCDCGIDFNSLIEKAVLTRNNGLGQVQFTLDMTKQGGYPGKDEDPVVMEVLRKIKPIIDLNEDSTFFEFSN
jgi:hypothetical protein